MLYSFLAHLFPEKNKCLPTILRSKNNAEIKIRTQKTGDQFPLRDAAFNILEHIYLKNISMKTKDNKIFFSFVLYFPFF